MRTYYYVSLEVEPKRIKLAKSEKELGEATEMRQNAEAKLKAVTDRVAALEAALLEAQEKMQQLEDEVAKCTVQLSNADKLIGGLGGEAKSWEETVATLGVQLTALVGDVLVCAATISYLGPFTAAYRGGLIDEWLAAMVAIETPHTPQCTIGKILADPVQVRQWSIDGLPADAFSIENGIIMSSTKRWPLLIDPQTQANRFIKNSQAAAQLKAVKASDATKKIQQSLEMGIRLGQPVLLENVLETLDPFLDPVPRQPDVQGRVRDARDQARRPGDPVPPRLPLLPDDGDPEPALRARGVGEGDGRGLLNCTRAPAAGARSRPSTGLEDQLLVATVETERPALAEKKSQLVVESAENKKRLQELQDEILYLLSHSEGNILDDTKLIDTLGVSKVTSEEIMVAVKEADAAEEEIDATRAKYIPVAFRGSTLFFAIADLTLVDPMYQYSLAWFKELFVRGITNAEASDDMDTRISNLNEYITYLMYTNVCR